MPDDTPKTLEKVQHDWRVERGVRQCAAMHPEMTRGYDVVACASAIVSVERRQQPDRRAYDREQAARQQVDDMKRVQQRLKDRAGTGGEGSEGALM